MSTVNDTNDIREWRKEKKKLQSFQRIARALAHDLKNAVSNIDLSAKQLEEENTSREDKKEYLEIIARNNDKINNYLNRLLAATTFDKLNKEKISLPEIINNILSEKEKWIKKRDIRTIKKYKKELPQIPADKEDLKVVFSQIICNALEAMEGRENTLTIAVNILEKEAIITISDNGIGMETPIRSKIFEPYFSTKNKVGLGLTEAGKIIMHHHGSIAVKSSPEKGTSFFIHLPLF